MHHFGDSPLTEVNIDRARYKLRVKTRPSSLRLPVTAPNRLPERLYTAYSRHHQVHYRTTDDGHREGPNNLGQQYSTFYKCMFNSNFGSCGTRRSVQN